jgi:phage-related baseplate assembly protein|nr:baseplate J/gp47 family protein [uncultured Selenomonas sp.]DAV19478.1 MAG TPA: baseplate assembly protein [Caudoviricetes sp.]
MGLKNLEQLKFVDANPEEMEIHVLDIVEALLKRKLARADPLRLFLLGIEALLIQQRLLFDQMAKMNLLAYAKGSYLDHIGALVGTERLPASPATVTMKLTLSAAREQAVIVPKGARITAGDNIYFALSENAIIPAGKLSVAASATCIENGGRGNGYLPGEISRIVDPVPFWAAAENTTKSEGGADVEDDESYRERIHEAPEKFSTAGPTLAYEYHAKAASAIISDVSVDSPAPGEVDVYPLLKGGVIPGEEVLSLVREKLNNRRIRPLTDKVSVKVPESVKYDIEARYYIDRRDATEAAAIQTRAENAVQEFIAWQKEKLGRDINPTELYYRLRAAGVKRAEIKSPVFKKTEKNQVAIADHVNVTFGGLEDE